MLQQLIQYTVARVQTRSTEYVYNKWGQFNAGVDHQAIVLPVSFNLLAS